MSDRDKQLKQDRDSNIEGSMFAKVNAGSNAAYDTSEDIKSSRKVDSLLVKLIYYIIGFSISGLLVYLGSTMFQDTYFNVYANEQLVPTLILIAISGSTGFLIATYVIKLFK